MAIMDQIANPSANGISIFNEACLCGGARVRYLALGPQYSRKDRYQPSPRAGAAALNTIPPTSDPAAANRAKTPGAAAGLIRSAASRCAFGALVALSAAAGPRQRP